MTIAGAEASPDLGTVSATAGRRSAWSALRRGRGLVGVVLVGCVVLAGLLAPLLALYAPNEQIPGANMLGPSPAHWLGTDEVNRDIFSRTLYGIRADLFVVFVAVPIGAAFGVLIGLLSTMYGTVEVVVQRIFDLLLAFPVLILAIAMTAVLGPGLRTVAIVIIAAELPVFGRLVRSSVLTVRELPYVEASRVIGARNGWLLRRHLLPNSLEPLTVQLGVSMSIAVIIEGAMSFLGLGIRPPDPSLGSLIQDGIRNVWETRYATVGPLTVVAMLVLGFLLISQALSEAHRA